VRFFLIKVVLSDDIRYFCENVSELPDPKNHRSLGLCTGLLAATAVTCAKSLSDLLPLAVEAVRISFRAGVVVGSVRDALQSSSDSDKSWSTIVANTSEAAAQAALEQFHAAKAVPLSKRAYVSAVSLVAVTISGPPSTTSELFGSGFFQGATRIPIPVFAPYHAAHLFGETDYNRILDDGIKANLRFFAPSGLLHSAQAGHCHEASSATELFQLALEEILAAPVRWDNLLNEAVAQIAAGGECSVMAVGVTNIANSFLTSLKASGQAFTTRDHTTWGAPSESFGRTQYDKIAIVGMAGRFPSAANHDELWALLEKGLDVHREVPSDRFDAKAHCDPTGKGKNKAHTPYGCFIDEPGLFDPRFFNMSPREANQTDPMGRLALVTAYEALEMSGYVPNRTPSTRLHRIGTFYGQTSDDWREINAAENIDTYFITGGVRAFAPGRINYYFKFSGPSYSIDTACSSSLAAIQLACTSLWAGDCDTACAGGLNVLTNPDIFSGLSKGQFLSKTGSCKTYDNGADGYCRGDGCGTVILKRYEDAIADNDNILACILGAATNHSAEAVSITHPHAGAQEFLYKKVLEQSGVDAHDISYVEMHGTGTQAGDGIEMTSVTNAFAPRNRQRRPDQVLNLGAVKANIGHGEGEIVELD
jgi:3-oxoacyl-(acyl-carrier-protein) synthase